MAGLRQDTALRQQTALSPRLYQSMKILRLDARDLLDLIQRELEQNPALELPEPSAFDRTEALPAEQRLWQEQSRSQRQTVSRAAADDRVNATELTASPVTLADHLTLQLDMAELPPRQHRIGLVIIGSLDAEGYLRDPVDCIGAATGIASQDIESVLAVVQGFDPPGVAARSLEECLLIQLRQLNAGRLARDIVEHCLPEVARSAYAEIGRRLAVPAARVERAVATIRELNPSPGSLFDTSPPAAAVIPDVFTHRSGDEITLMVNQEILPPLKLSREYSKLGGDPAAAEAADWMKQKTREASRLIRDVRQRSRTISRVAAAIVTAQAEFFRRGPDHLRPLLVEDVARSLEVHPSTVSRAILGKYMNTPYGIYEFKYFFSSGYSAGDGRELAATAVKKKIGSLVRSEDTAKPLSDQKISALLAREQINISRRTVAKYRDELGILPSWQRKRRHDCRESGP